MIEALLKQARNIAALPDDNFKKDLIAAAEDVVFRMLVDEEITAEERQKILQILREGKPREE